MKIVVRDMRWCDVCGKWRLCVVVDDPQPRTVVCEQCNKKSPNKKRGVSR